MDSIAAIPTRISVAHLGPDPAGGGGMAAVIRGLLDSPLADLYDLEMIVTYRSPQPIARLATFLRALADLVRWSVRRGPRLAHVHTAVRGSLYRKAISVLLARLLLRPVLLHVHAGMGDIEAFEARLDPVRRWFFRRALRSATRVLAVSAESARMMERCFDIDGIVVVPNAAPMLPPGVEPLEPGLDAEPRVLYLGGFANPMKGGTVMVAALDSMAKECPLVSFVVAGPGERPPDLAALQRKRPNVLWSGWLDEQAKHDELARCGVFVLPSLSEGLPVALLEAMAWGRAIVATRVGGVPEVVTDGVEAIVVPPGDPGPLGGAVRGLLGDPERSRRLGRAARARASSLNDNEVCGRLDALYREVVA
jgi:glycosyltransferase involved in cell wall biosynthesis